LVNRILIKIQILIQSILLMNIKN